MRLWINACWEVKKCLVSDNCKLIKIIFYLRCSLSWLIFLVGLSLRSVQFSRVWIEFWGTAKWSWVNVDLWDPMTICNKNSRDYKKHVITMIDSVTGWFKLSQLKGTPDAFVYMKRFDSAWLTCYPHPREIWFDNGGEFMAEFSELCDNMDLKQRLLLRKGLRN